MSNQLGDRRVCPKTGATMVYVPSGKFMMGSDNGDSDERPVHEQVIPQSLWLDLTPVTNAAYAKFVEEGGYQQRDLWTAAGWAWREEKSVSAPEDYAGFTAPDQPQVGISWYEAYAYAKWRGGRLPTEAEWEWVSSMDKPYPYRADDGRETQDGMRGWRALRGGSWGGGLDDARAAYRNGISRDYRDSYCGFRVAYDV